MCACVQAASQQQLIRIADFIQRTYTAYVSDSHEVSENALWARSGYAELWYRPEPAVPSRRCQLSCGGKTIYIRIYGFVVESGDVEERSAPARGHSAPTGSHPARGRSGHVKRSFMGLVALSSLGIRLSVDAGASAVVDA